MIILTQEEQNQFMSWLLHEVTNLKRDQKPTILANYIKSLLKRDVQANTMKELLIEFIGAEKTDSFVDSLHDRLARKDFSFQETTAPPPKPVEPPPKQPEPKPAPKSARSTTTSKPQSSASTKSEVKPSTTPSVKTATTADTTAKAQKETIQSRDQSEPQTQAVKPSETKKEAPPTVAAKKTAEISTAKPQQKLAKQQKKDAQIPNKIADEQNQQNQQINNYNNNNNNNNNSNNNNNKITNRQNGYNNNNNKNGDYNNNNRQRREGMVKQPPLDPSKRLFSDASDPDDDYVEAPVEEFSEAKIEPKATEPAERYVIFAAGVDKNISSISGLFKKFTKFGRILAIEVNVEEKVAYIEYDELLSAFKAIKSNQKINIMGNSLIRIDYAIDPNPEKLEALEAEYKKREEMRNQKKIEKQQLLQQQQQQQTIEISQEMEEDTKEDQPSAENEEDQIIADIKKSIQIKMKEIKECKEPEQKAKFTKELEELQNMLENVTQL